MVVQNVMEQVVRDTLATYKNSLPIVCDCERCQNDIMAIALNELPPRYVANSSLSPYVRAAHETDRQGATNIITVITKAAKVVGANPRCQEYSKNQSS